MPFFIVGVLLLFVTLHLARAFGKLHGMFAKHLLVKSGEGNARSTDEVFSAGRWSAAIGLFQSMHTHLVMAWASRARALRMTRIFRIAAMTATLPGFPVARSDR
ncbi:hypothetical protein ACFQS6_12520 [Xanthomonas populi]